MSVPENSLAIALPPELLDAITDEVAQRLAALAPPLPEPLLTVPEAADYLACKPKRIYDLCSQGRLPHSKDGSRTLIRRADIDAYLGRG